MLVVTADYGVDFEESAQQMTHLIDKNSVGPMLRQWMALKFTTTAQTGRIAASAIILATFRQYFEYEIALAPC